MYWCWIILTITIIIYILRPQPQPHSPRTKYLFISGGYDSIFRLCQLVIMEQTPVQPIYLNIPKTDGVKVRRQNIPYEINSIKNSINELTKMGYGHLIYPIQYITKCKLSNSVIEACQRFYREGKFSRVITQYTYMIQISLQMNKIIESGVLCSRNGAIWQAVGPIINKETQMIDLNKIRHRDDLVFRNLKFPLCGMTKNQMLHIAKENGFCNILHMTISCWFPVNGKPCNKCIMCRERII